MFALCSVQVEGLTQVWTRQWVRGQLWCLPMSQDKEWRDMYLVRYLGCSSLSQFEHGVVGVGVKHNVHFFGSPHIKQGKMPENPPLLYPAFLSNVDFRNGHPRILFTNKRESCSEYTGVITERDLMEGERVFDDGSEQYGQEGRRLTQDSWNRILTLGRKHNRQLSFDLK